MDQHDYEQELRKYKFEHEQLRERAERMAQRAHTVELELYDLREKYKRLERDRNALLAELRALRSTERHFSNEELIVMAQGEPRDCEWWQPLAGTRRRIERSFPNAELACTGDRLVIRIPGPPERQATYDLRDDCSAENVHHGWRQLVKAAEDEARAAPDDR